MLVDATDIDRWADTRDAESRLPQVIRRLVLATVTEVEQIDFRAGEGVVLPGWDGLLSTRGGDPFVPEGVSRWELTRTGDAKGKAQEDYDKRSTDPLGANPADAAFVFLTAHRWAGKEDWVAERSTDGIWREVRALDADSLETWLEQAPAVHIWLSRQLGKHPPDATDLETYWEDWCGVTSPHMSVPVVIGGRRSQAERLLEWIADSPSLLSLQAETEGEAIAFLAAAVHELPPEDRDRLYARSAIVSGDESWRELSFAARPLILLPQFPDRQKAPAAVGRGHHVLLPFARNNPTDHTTLMLPAVETTATNTALRDMGFDEEEAGQLASLAWRGLAILRRRLAVSPALMTPAWALLPEARQLLPAVLAGRWDEAKKADRDVLSTLAQEPYARLREQLIVSSSQPDAPVRRIGEKWHTVARADSWSLLAGFLTEEELDRFRESAVQVLRERDPKFELPSAERYAAAIHGNVPMHSHDLREGVAETIALLGAFEGVQGRLSGSQWASWIVRETLEAADWMLWASLMSQLPTLAEASPSDFMNAVEIDVRSASPSIATLFHEEEELFETSSSVGLLWALERLAWAPEHLRRSTMLLARIDEITERG